MKIRTTLCLVASHIAVAVVGFAAGIYALPILIAPAAPSSYGARPSVSSLRLQSTSSESHHEVLVNGLYHF
jgi:hypothetical protein